LTDRAETPTSKFVVHYGFSCQFLTMAAAMPIFGMSLRIVRDYGKS
jgi:hypothetical protein